MDIVLVGFMAGLTFAGIRTGLILRLFGLLFIAIAFVLGAYLRGPFGALVTSIIAARCRWLFTATRRLSDSRNTRTGRAQRTACEPTA